MNNNSTNPFKPTPVDIMSKIIGRDAAPVLKLNKPEFKEAIIKPQSKGIKWFASLIKIETNPYNHSK